MVRMCMGKQDDDRALLEQLWTLMREAEDEVGAREGIGTTAFERAETLMRRRAPWLFSAKCWSGHRRGCTFCAPTGQCPECALEKLRASMRSLAKQVDDVGSEGIVGGLSFAMRALLGK